jgi:hypothetical protein
MNLFTIPPVSPEFRAWQDRVGFGEFQCEACNQSYLERGTAFEHEEDIHHRFCSNFCRQAANQHMT